MKIEQEELDRRAAYADRARMILRRATLELLAVREELLKQHKDRKDEGRSRRSDHEAVADTQAEDR